VNDYSGKEFEVYASVRQNFIKGDGHPKSLQYRANNALKIYGLSKLKIALILANWLE